jgi:hypothetical protein
MDVKVTDDKVSTTHPNFKTEFTVSRASNGTGMWSIKSSIGKMPAKLEGLYTSSNAAQRALEMYLVNSKETSTVRRDNYAAERKERKIADAAKLQPEDSK